MKITITDIAKDTGLSLATISKYLNHKKVLPENRILIENSIEKLGYTPNRIAQGLRAEKTNTIAIVIPSLSNYFWGPITTYIETTLRERGYRSIVYTISSDFQRQQYVINHILNNKVDGVIAVVSYWTEQALSALHKHAIPVVFLDQITSALQSDYVTSDNYQGGYTAGEYLIRHNHKKIGFIAGLKDSYTIQERTRGFLSAIKNAGLPLTPEYYSYENEDASNGKEQIQKLLRSSSFPTALFFCSLELCLDGIATLLDDGFKIPQDVSIISFDDDIIFSSIRPHITVIRQNLQEIGKQAALLLLHRLENNNDTSSTKQILVPTALIERDSVHQL